MIVKDGHANTPPELRREPAAAVLLTRIQRPGSRQNRLQANFGRRASANGLLGAELPDKTQKMLEWPHSRRYRGRGTGGIPNLHSRTLSQYVSAAKAASRQRHHRQN